MRQAESLKVLLADKEKGGLIHCIHGSGVVAAVEHGQLRHRTARAFDAEHLLSAAGGTLENSQVARCDDVESGAWLPFSEYSFAGREPACDRTLGEEQEFVFAEPGKN